MESNIESIFENARDAKEISFLLKRLGYFRPEKLARLFFKTPFYKRNPLAPASYPHLIKLLNLGLERYLEDRQHFSTDKTGTHVGFGVKTNRFGAHIELTHLKIFAVINASYKWPEPFAIEHIESAWFRVTPKTEPRAKKRANKCEA